MTTPYRVLVTGSRDWDDHATIRDALMQARWSAGPMVPMIVAHGACPTGADATASWWAYQHRGLGVTEERHPADWHIHGRAAGPIRNVKMVRLGADLCLAFIRGGSRGGSHTAGLAEAAGIPVRRWTA